MLCEEARRIGGTTVWCHNGMGMETPVAAALGLLNAYNIADGMEADYDRYYRFLNCGFRLPVSSGTDWWIYDHNRVFVQVQGEFTYDTWIAGLRAGRTFVSNGPLLEFRVNGKEPGASIETSGMLKVSATVVSRLPFERLQIVYNGEVIAERSARNQPRGEAGRRDRRNPGRLAGGSRLRRRSDARRQYGVRAYQSRFMSRVPGTPHRKAEVAGTFRGRDRGVDAIHSQELSFRKGCRSGAGAGPL